MSIVHRYFEVIGDGITRLEELAEQRRADQQAANDLAARCGFEACGMSKGLGGERVIGFVMPKDGDWPNEKHWKTVSRIDDDRYVWMPKRTSKDRKALSDQISELTITDRQTMLDTFGLKGWEVMEPAGRSLRVASATCGNLSGMWVVVVPEKEFPDEYDDKTFDGHEWLREMTLAEFRSLQRQQEDAA